MAPEHSGPSQRLISSVMGCSFISAWVKADYRQAPPQKRKMLSSSGAMAAAICSCLQQPDLISAQQLMGRKPTHITTAADKLLSSHLMGAHAPR